MFVDPSPISPASFRPQEYTVALRPAIARVSKPLVATWVTPDSGTGTGVAEPVVPFPR